MPLQCPACGEQVHAEHVDVAQDAAACPYCQERFRPSTVLPSAEPAVSTPPAPRSGAFNVEYPPEGGIRVHIPPAGLFSKALIAFAFALIWNLILIPLCGAFVFGMIKGEVPWAVILFLLPFLAVGVLAVYIACRLAWARTTLWLDRDGFAIVRELFGHQRSRAFLLDDVERFSREVSYRQNNRPVFACQARVGRKKINFGHRLSEPDQEWLIAELKRILTDLRK